MTALGLVLITGVNGFLGKHVAETLLSDGFAVVGTGRSSSCRLQHERLQYVRLDMMDEAGIQSLLRSYEFTHIVHLAGANDVRKSYEDPMHTLGVNVGGALYLLEALRQINPAQLQAFVAAGTAYEYDLKGSLLKEDCPVLPVSPYAWSKHMMTSVLRMYGRIYQLPTRIARTFNLIGPGGGAGACSQFAREVAAMEKGTYPAILQTGNLETKRDFLDVRDAASAYCRLLLAKSPLPGSVYNVCSGHAYSLREIVQLLKKHARIPFDIQIDASRFRVSDVPHLAGSCEKLKLHTGWEPSIPLEQSVLDTLNEYRATAP
ncbi:GDP-mannose 4,6-dehydratase [Paenibacillus hexagrammi]|uniref:GDP-mannose 4,6-dehydratase n=1 Tax=Paenibacillus hexagrammi TaxID=2908839 RepID=A0ABY3SQW2_9BACL|nr:GDP-mannose 4,6-dehydratase [Paenibacillus sp. YPD9-1]UJF35790.1 GDP-mannose 4,6-dehydratase [Paenibacillus sp. YPD9-1]